MAELKRGDHVTWSTSQGKTEGTVVKKVTQDTQIEGHHAKASPEAPQFVVKSEKTGKMAVHKPEALKKAR